MFTCFDKLTLWMFEASGKYVADAADADSIHSLKVCSWFVSSESLSIQAALFEPACTWSYCHLFCRWIHAEYTIKWGAIIVIFFLTGITLKTRVLLDASKRLSIHILIQFISLVSVLHFQGIRHIPVLIVYPLSCEILTKLKIWKRNKTEVVRI